MLSNFSWISFILGVVFALFILPFAQSMIAGHVGAKSVQTA